MYKFILYNYVETETMLYQQMYTNSFELANVVSTLWCQSLEEIYIIVNILLIKQRISYKYARICLKPFKYVSERHPNSLDWHWFQKKHVEQYKQQ